MAMDWLTGGELWPTLLVALLLDAAVGYPAWLYHRVPHPVALLGRLIGAGERQLYPDPPESRAAFARGLLLTVGVVGIAAGLGLVVVMVAAALPGGWLLAAVFASTLIALRDLHEHGNAVAAGLD